MSDNTRFCIECKHYSLPWNKRLTNFDARCTKDSVQLVNLVNGKIIKSEFDDLDRCRSNRSKDYENNKNHCGPGGKFWVPKDDTAVNLMKLLSK